jgi:adenylate cyclase
MTAIRNKWSQAALIGIAAGVASLALCRTELADRVESRTWDWRARRMAGEGAATAHIKLILLDQTDLDWGRDSEMKLSWPWPRATYAAVARFCKRAGARSLMFDMVYTEPSGWGVEDDDDFGRALAESQNAGVGLVLSREQGALTNWPGWASHPSQKLCRFHGIGEYGAMFGRGVVLNRAAFPVPRIATNSAWLASVYGDPDDDAIFRRNAPFHVFDSVGVPSLGLASYLAAHPSPWVEFAGGQVDAGGVVIPLDSHGRAILKFRRPDAYQSVHAASVIQSELRLQAGETNLTVQPSCFTNAYVLFGVSAPGLMDLKPVPTSKVCPGVVVHATFLDNLLSGDFVREVPRHHAAACTIAFALLCAVLGRMASKGWQSGLSFVLVLVPLAVGTAAYGAGWWVPVVEPTLGGLLALTGTLVLNYAIEGRQKRFIKSAFQQYLSEAVIEKLVQNPDALKLGGETRELSIFFSDLQGFTSISEVLTPEQLTALLNDYLTEMCDIIMDEGGTVDKFEGDAIIAFWNAPLDLAEHAECAVRSALRCQRKLAELRVGYRERVKRDLYMRVGVNTGKVVIGNMGSQQRFNYTFLGDAGNLASRLEGINKQFGTYLMISEHTNAMVRGAFPARELSRVRVVGKAVPVRVFEPMWREDFEARKDVIAQFGRGLQEFYKGNFKDAIAIMEPIAEADAAARSYVRKCLELMDHPPERWDGVWEMKEK